MHNTLLLLMFADLKGYAAGIWRILGPNYPKISARELTSCLALSLNI